MRRTPKDHIQKWYVGDSGRPVGYSTTPHTTSVNGYVLYDTLTRAITAAKDAERLRHADVMSVLNRIAKEQDSAKGK